MAASKRFQAIRRWLGRFAVILAAGTCFAWGLAVLPWVQAAAKYDKALAEAKAAGVVTNEAEFVGTLGTMNPKAVVAASDLGKNVRSRGREHVQVFETALRTQEPKAVGDVLAVYAPAMDAAFSLGTNPGVLAERDYSDPVNVMLPEYADVKFGAKLLCLRIGWRAAAGDLDGVLADLDALDGLAVSSAAEPILIGQMVAASLSTMRLDAIVRAAGDYNWDPASLRKLRDKVSTPQRPDADRGLIGESFIGYYIAQNFSRELAQGTSLSPNDYYPTFVPIGLVRRAYSARILELYTQVARAPKGEKWRVLVDARNAAIKSGNRIDQIVENTVPALEGMAVSLLSNKTKTVIADALLRIAEARVRTGVWPKDWEAIPGGVRVSPLGESPLRFKVEGQKLTVYSIGLDGVDDTATAPMFPEKSDDVEYSWTAAG